MMRMCLGCKINWEGRLMETSVQHIGQKHRGESVTLLYDKACFSYSYMVALHRVGFQNRCWNSVITWLIFWPVLTFYVLKQWLPNPYEWNNCPHLLLSTMHSAQVAMRKCDLGCGHSMAWLRVHCHGGVAKAYKVMPCHEM